MVKRFGLPLFDLEGFNNPACYLFTKFRGFITVKLDNIQPCLSRNLVYCRYIFIHKYADCCDKWRELFNNLSCLMWLYKSWTIFIKYKPDGICAVFTCCMSKWVNHRVIVVDSPDRARFAAKRGIAPDQLVRVIAKQWNADKKFHELTAASLKTRFGAVLIHQNA